MKTQILLLGPLLISLSAHAAALYHCAPARPDSEAPTFDFLVERYGGHVNRTADGQTIRGWLGSESPVGDLPPGGQLSYRISGWGGESTVEYLFVPTVIDTQSLNITWIAQKDDLRETRVPVICTRN